MTDRKIQQIWQNSYEAFLSSGYFLSDAQKKASYAIMNCKTGSLGMNISLCPDCGHMKFHNNSCRNRNCPNCQAVNKELWVDRRRAEVIDSPYFHVVFTLPHELNSLIYCNQKLLYGFFHRCCAETLLELSADKKHLGATPGIIQVLHTWDQEINYHVHMHCIVSGAGLQSFFQNRQLYFSASCEKLRDSYEWSEFRNSLYQKDWCPYVKETFNGFGNALEYLGRYTHKVAISNSRILSINEQQVTFSARSRTPGKSCRTVTLDNTEFIRRYLMHVLPPGFQKIRYYGFLNNRYKTRNLKLIFKLQRHQRFKAKYTNLSMAELLKTVWNIDIHICPEFDTFLMNYTTVGGNCVS